VEKISKEFPLKTQKQAHWAWFHRLIEIDSETPSLVEGVDAQGRHYTIAPNGALVAYDNTMAFAVDPQGRVTVSGVETAPVEERNRNMRAAARMRADLNGRPLPIEMDAIRSLFGFVDLVCV
jgi:hypothetical protein